MPNQNIWSYEFEKSKEIGKGQLLLSEPFMLDENFRRTVVLICDHNEENGTVGLVLNKPINLRLTDVVEDFPSFKAPLFLGGPVGTDTLQFLHTLGDQIEDSIKIADNLYWGGDFEQLKTLIELEKVSAQDIRFYLGYSGWGFHQLEEEMKENSWILTPATHHHIFKTDYTVLWKNTMQHMGGVYETMATYPENPLLN
ncbi:MAG: YqgE/AlgH family protein [Bacteroidetes bacterium]|nr:YqgE/AlgH family protein [Bacteroidota bacterium]